MEGSKRLTEVYNDTLKVDYGRIRWAGQYGTFYRITSPFSDFMAGKLKINIFPPIQVDPHNLEWDLESSTESPYDNPTWRLYYHSLVWLSDFLLEAVSESDSQKKQVVIEQVIEVVKSWSQASLASRDTKRERWNGHCVSMRIAHLLFLRTWCDEAWLHSLIGVHAEELVTHFSGYWNHGLSESTTLYGAGQELGVQEWQNLGKERVLDCVEVMIDEEGATNEQAPGYSGYVYRLVRASLRVFEAYEDDSLQEIGARLEALEKFTVHSLDPQRRYIPIGDSYPDYPPTPTPQGPLTWFAKPGEGGRPLSDKTAVYKRGYIFSRASWGVNELPRDNTYLTIRFGPGRTAIHGHEDAGSVTLWSHERHVIVDSGHVGYEQTPMRSYMQSLQAHNVFEVPGIAFEPKSRMDLVEQWRSDDGSQVRFSLSDHAFDGVERHRDVCMFHRGPLFVADAAHLVSLRRVEARQLWHLSPEFQLSGVDGPSSRYDSVLGDVKLHIVSFELKNSEVDEPAHFSHWRGNREPLMGWAASGHRTAVPTTSIGLSTFSDHPRIVTAIIPSKTEEIVTWSIKTLPAGYAAFRVHRGDQYFAVNVYDAGAGGSQPLIEFR